jgi:hypothetical protein
LHILTLNIQAGGGQRVGRLLPYLDQQDPHTVVLTEWRANLVGVQITTWAQTRGMQYASLTDGGTANGVFVASKTPFVSSSRRPEESGVGVLMLAKFSGFSLLACYSPQLTAKAPFFARCVELAAEHAARPFLMLGDLNTGNQIVDKDVKGGSYHCADAFDTLSSRHGLRDLWRFSNGAHAREWTWLSRSQNGFRIDHAPGNDTFLDWAHPSCRYDLLATRRLHGPQRNYRRMLGTCQPLRQCLAEPQQPTKETVKHLSFSQS